MKGSLHQPAVTGETDGAPAVQSKRYEEPERGTGFAAVKHPEASDARISRTSKDPDADEIRIFAPVHHNTFGNTKLLATIESRPDILGQEKRLNIRRSLGKSGHEHCPVAG